MTKEEYWKNYDSEDLCEYLPHKFDIWWKPYKFNWDKIDYLRYYLLNKITDWYIPEIEIIYPKNIIDIKDIKKFISDLEWNYE